MERILKEFKTFEKPREGLDFNFELLGATYKVRFMDDCKLRKYVEFVPKLDFVAYLTKGWRDERVEIYRKGDLYLLLYIPKNAERDINIPFIMIEKKIKEKCRVRWEPIAWLYYHYFNFNGIYLTVRKSVEFLVETAIKENWEIKLS